MWNTLAVRPKSISWATLSIQVVKYKWENAGRCHFMYLSYNFHYNYMCLIVYGYIFFVYTCVALFFSFLSYSQTTKHTNKEFVMMKSNTNLMWHFYCFTVITLNTLIPRNVIKSDTFRAVRNNKYCFNVEM